ncbi:MAG: hypothetical protein BM556_02570 [Bacteriovorax sp. MedPE-SWde]|nr:MAG: hypothetical protein BM556_02570 [Bacteriovorax sp. MedPE-SWde]
MKFLSIVALFLVISCNSKDTPVSKGSGGVIDGGGTNIDYAKVPYIEEQLDVAISLLTTNKEGMNLLRSLRDHFPAQYDENRRVRYTTTERFLETIYLRDSNEAILQKIIGNSYYVQDKLFKLCKWKKKRVVNLYSNNTLFKTANDKDCLNERLDRPMKTSGILKRELFHFKNKCFDLNGVEKVASVSSFDLNAKVCLSKSQLSQLPQDDVLKNLTAIIVHELAHMYGEGEQTSKKLEKFIISNFNRYNLVINNRTENIDEQRYNYTEGLLGISPTESPVYHADPTEIDFNYLHFELLNVIVELSKHPGSQFYTFQEIYPFRYENLYNQSYKEIEGIIERYFSINEKGLLTPKESFFTQEELQIIAGQPDNYDEWYDNWKMAISKYKGIFNEIKNEINKLYEELDEFDNQSPTTERIDNMLRLEEELLQSNMYDDDFSGP